MKNTVALLSVALFAIAATSQARAQSDDERPGDGGENVAWVQQRLNQMGYDCGTIDGVMGSSTHSCIRAFQQANGLRITGAINETTYENMLAASQPEETPQEKQAPQSEQEATQEEGRELVPQNEPESQEPPERKPQPHEAEPQQVYRTYPGNGISVRLGRDFSDVEKFFFGLGGRFQLSSFPVTINPALDVFLLQRSTASNVYASATATSYILQIDANALYAFQTGNPSISPYVGAGPSLSLLGVSVEASNVYGETESNSDFTAGVGFNLLGGATFLTGKYRPFAEIQYTLGTQFDGASVTFFTFKGGVVFSL